MTRKCATPPVPVFRAPGMGSPPTVRPFREAGITSLRTARVFPSSGMASTRTARTFRTPGDPSTPAARAFRSSGNPSPRNLPAFRETEMPPLWNLRSVRLAGNPSAAVVGTALARPPTSLVPSASSVPSRPPRTAGDSGPYRATRARLRGGLLRRLDTRRRARGWCAPEFWKRRSPLPNAKC